MARQKRIESIKDVARACAAEIMGDSDVTRPGAFQHRLMVYIDGAPDTPEARRALSRFSSVVLRAMRADYCRNTYALGAELYHAIGNGNGHPMDLEYGAQRLNTYLRQLKTSQAAMARAVKSDGANPKYVGWLRDRVGSVPMRSTNSGLADYRN